MLMLGLTEEVLQHQKTVIIIRNTVLSKKCRAQRSLRDGGMGQEASKLV